MAETGMQAEDGGTVRREVARVTAQARGEASRMGREIADHLRAMLAGEQRAVSSQIDGVVAALEAAAQKLEDSQQSTIAHYAGSAADGLRQASQGLKDADPTDLIRQAEDLARRQPALFIGGAVAAGFLLARFLQSRSGGGTESAQGELQ